MSIDDFRAVAHAKLSVYQHALTTENGLGDSVEEWDAFFRDIHSIKGNAGFFQLDNVRRVAHCLENLLDLLRSRRIARKGVVEELLSQGLDLLDTAVAGSGFQAVWADDFEKDIQRLTDRVDHAASTPADELESLARLLRERAIDGAGGWAALDSVLRGAEAVRRELETADRGQWAQVLSEASFRLKPEVTRVLGRLQEFLTTLEFRPLSDDEAKSLLESLLAIRFQFPKNPRIQTAVIILEPLARFANDASLASSPQYRREFRTAALDLWTAVLGPSPTRVQKTGEILVEEGLIQPDDVRNAVNRQKKIGEILVEQGKVQAEDVERSLARQKRQMRMRDLFQVETGLIALRTDQLSDIERSLAEIRTGLELANDGELRGTKSPGTDGRRLRLFRSSVERLSHLVSSLRSVRFADVVEYLPRHVRDVSYFLDARVELRISGEAVEIPRETAAALSGPILHLVNNAMAHGVARKRLDGAKSSEPARGTIWVAAREGEGELMIEVSDDGPGWSPHAVVARAIRDGFIDEAEARSLTEADIADLLFRPGFSTAERVDEWSGRGVGLDAVAQTLEALGGRIEARNAPGQGARFLMRVPRRTL